MAGHRTRPDAGFINPEALPVGPGGRRLCRCGCGQEVPRGRHTFASQACVHGWKLQTNPGYVRRLVLERDHGICCRCGRDTTVIDQELLDLWRATTDERRAAGWLRGTGPASCALEARERAEHRRYDQHAWEAHHKLAVAEGGGLCGLDGYETLCLRCHHQETRALAGRLKVQRNPGRHCQQELL